MKTTTLTGTVTGPVRVACEPQALESWHRFSLVPDGDNGRRVEVAYPHFRPIGPESPVLADGHRIQITGMGKEDGLFLSNQIKVL